jgi:hypothetical protein
MSERLTATFTRTAERVAVTKEPEPNDEGFYDYALIGAPTTVRSWLRDAPFDVLGPWVGALVEGDPQSAVVVVRSTKPLEIPTGLKLFDPAAARGLLGVWAGR